MKKRTIIIIWNVLVGAITVILPLIIQHKDLIIKHAKKMKV